MRFVFNKFFACLVLNAFPLVTGKQRRWMQQNELVSRETADFIESYRNCPVLWDVCLQDCKKNLAKLDQLRLYAEQYWCDVQTVKSKVKNLRTAFRSELSSRTRKKSGSSSIKKSKWFGHDMLRFLEDVEIARFCYSSQVDNCWEDMHHECLRAAAEDRLFTRIWLYYMLFILVQYLTKIPWISQIQLYIAAEQGIFI